VTYTDVPANWYPDPAGGGGLRYWDGSTWTGHVVPPAPAYYPPYGTWGPPPWKGAQLGRPATGPGALANPGRRLAARALDWLLMLPVFAILLTASLLIFAPRFGPIFPDVNNNNGNAVPAPGFLWVYLTVFACALLTGLVMVAYETVGVAKFGRTFGMAWLHIRPVRTESGGTLGWGRAFGRAGIYWLAGFLGWIGLLDPLWCLWDDKRQCLHDKVVDSIVINDTASAPATGEATPVAVAATT
jgi:uncharacterized RDD family membrane protein YckC